MSKYQLIIFTMLKFLHLCAWSHLELKLNSPFSLAFSTLTFIHLFIKCLILHMHLGQSIKLTFSKFLTFLLFLLPYLSGLASCKFGGWL